MTKKPVLWILLALFTLGSAVFSWRYFSRAFPLVTLDIRMDRKEALARTRALADQHHLGPADFRDAASFSLDESVQTFVELEGGGKPAFTALVADPLYTPYRWRVRHFKEREKQEVTFFFAPDGTPIGFSERLREDTPGAALAGTAARDIAQSSANRLWRVDFAPFQPVEQSQERRPGGRVDHTFVYERSDRQLGEGRYRMRLVVSGDRLTELVYFLKVPESFSRRYDQMRSVNTAIGVGGSLAFVVLYGVGGMAFGLFVLTRDRWVLWRQPVLWGAIVAFAQTAATVNEWPLTWMQYDTALSTESFIARQVSLGLTELAANVVLFSLSFMAAESLTRRAFPNHPQFWRLWGRDAGRSPQVLGRTVAGYLLVPVFIAYEVVLYFSATRWLHWWTPSEALFNPDVLAAYIPWFSAIAKSFQAGFWEESLFRAVPIAGAALLGDRLGNRRLWIVLGFIVQAVVFGAGHAPYPTQPAYARPVELMIPSMAFGLLYLTFGLLPGIILHFAFDAFWFAMPIFATTTAGIRLQQIVIVMAIFVPLWVLIARRASAGGGIDLPAAERNSGWRPEAVAARAAAPEAAPTTVAMPRSIVRSVGALGAVAAAAWILAALLLPVQRHSVRATRTEALSAARAALDSRRLGPQWRFLPVANEGGGPAHRFVWTTMRSMYDSQLGTYLELPGWTVFVRTFEGDVAERAETWTVHLDADGVVRRVDHKLPESRPGRTLDEAAARQLAVRALFETFQIDAASLKEVAVAPSKLPMRTDWMLTFSDASRPLPQGELRLSVEIAGDEIASVRRFVYVPEEWERTERNAATAASIVQVGGTALGVLMLVGGSIAAIVSWSRRRFAVRLFLAVFAVFTVLAAARTVNAYPSTMAALSTSQPLQLQLLVLIGASIVGLGLQSAMMALVAGAATVWAPGGRMESRRAVVLGLALGAVGAAARALSAWVTSQGPAWPSYAGATSLVPFVAASVNPVVTLLTRIVVLLLVVSVANRLTAGWTRRRPVVAALLVIVGGVLGTAGSPQNPVAWIASAVGIGALLAAAHVLVLRHDLSVVVIAAGVMTAAGTLREGSLQAYPGALAGSIVAVVVMALAASAWFRALRSPRP